MNFKSLPEAIHYFKDEQVCRDTLAKLRWPSGNIICPICGAKNAYRMGDCKTYKCRSEECKANFNVTVGTLMENTKLPLCKWFAAMWLLF